MHNDRLKRKKYKGYAVLRSVWCAFLLVMLVCVAACQAKDGDAVPQAAGTLSHYDGTTTVLCYGDSNTYGYDPATDGERYPDSVRWTNLLAEALGNDYYVITEGLSGRTTAYDRPNAEWKNGLTSLPACLGSQKPVDIVVFMLGTNDCMKSLALTPEEITSGMESLVTTTKEMTRKVQGYEPEIVIVAPPQIDPFFEGGTFQSLYDEASAGKSRELAVMYEALAQKCDCYFVDAADCMVSDLDGVHLTEEGHQQLEMLVYDCIVQIK